VTEAHRC